MEIGDLFYVIILIVFMILGFFNDSKKKKKQQSQPQETTPRGFYDDEDTKEWQSERTVPPPIPGKITHSSTEKTKSASQYEQWERERHKKEGEVIFRSSMDLVTDFSKESSLKSSIYKHDTGTLYDQEPDTISYEMVPDSPDMPENPTHDKRKLHPLVRELTGENRKSELVKGLIYGEILRAKY